MPFPHHLLSRAFQPTVLPFPVLQLYPYSFFLQIRISSVSSELSPFLITPSIIYLHSIPASSNPLVSCFLSYPLLFQLFILPPSLSLSYSPIQRFLLPCFLPHSFAFFSRSLFLPFSIILGPYSFSLIPIHLRPSPTPLALFLLLFIIIPHIPFTYFLTHSLSVILFPSPPTPSLVLSPSPFLTHVLPHPFTLPFPSLLSRPPPPHTPSLIPSPHPLILSLTPQIPFKPFETEDLIRAKEENQHNKDEFAHTKGGPA